MRKLATTFLIVGVFVGDLTPTAFADVSPQTASMTVALTANTVSVGEPIILHYRISNFDNQELHINMGPDRKDWATITLTDAFGHPVTALPNPVPSVGGIHDYGPYIGPNSVVTGYDTISTKFRPSVPGRYHLTLSTHISYRIGQDTQSSEWSELYSLPLTVTTKDSNRLKADAEKLGQAIRHQVRTADDRAVIDALFSMPEDEAAPVWRSLATDTTLDDGIRANILRHLADVNSTAASDIIAAAEASDPQHWQMAGYGPGVALLRMRHSASPPLQRHIDELLGQSGDEGKGPFLGTTN